MRFFGVYSYAELGARYPSRGGAARFLIRCFGDGVISGGLNVFQFLGLIIAMALYAAGFASYARDLLPWQTPQWSAKAIGVGLIFVVVVVNLAGSKLVGRTETAIVAMELLILVGFVVMGLTKSSPGDFDTPAGDGRLGVLFAAGLLFVTYEGFGVVTNSAGDMRDPAGQLPRAMYLALAIVIAIYVAVSAVVVMTLSLPVIEASQGHALAESGKVILGQVGLVVIGVAALVAAASGVNATLFGDANLAFLVAKSGQMPKESAKNVWLGGTVGLFTAAGLTALFVPFFPLAAVGRMASLAFLLIYAAVSIGHLRIRGETGANAGMLVAGVALIWTACWHAENDGHEQNRAPWDRRVTLLPGTTSRR